MNFKYLYIDEKKIRKKELKSKMQKTQDHQNLSQNEIGGENESMTQKVIRSRSMLKYERTKYNHNIIKNNIIKFVIIILL